MDQTSNGQKVSIWQLFITSIPRAPWRGFIFGLFLPLILLQIGNAVHMAMLGLVTALAVCVIFCIIDTLRTAKLSVFPIITFFMIATQFVAHMFVARYHSGTGVPLLVMTTDNLVIAIFFLGSLFTRTPLILALLDTKTLESIPEKIRKSSYYINGWRLVTLLWGLLYVVQPFILVTLDVIHSSGKEIIDYILSWPTVAIFLVLSVMLPRWYWTKNIRFIEQGVTQAQISP